MQPACVNDQSTPADVRRKIDSILVSKMAGRDARHRLYLRDAIDLLAFPQNVRDRSWSSGVVKINVLFSNYVKSDAKRELF
jgi:hypothetical protein